MNQAFISYSTFDSKIAIRIYYDLKRAGMEVYLYEREGEYGVDFRNEIYNKLDEVNYFCLVDSPNARKSEWVKKECLYAKSRQNIKKIQPCFVYELGNWQSQNELFESHKELRGINFSGLDRLDYREVYRMRIQDLCEAFNAQYRPWSEIPGSRDFEKELAILDLGIEEKSFLKNDYSAFVYSTNRSFDTALSRINNLINDCEELKTEISILYLAKGRVLADSNDDKGALLIFQQLSTKFPDDPRSWAALSGAQFYTNQYRESLLSLDKAIEIISSNPGNSYMQQHLPEMVIKKIQLCIALNDYESARALLAENGENNKDLPELIIMEIKLHLLERKELLMDKYNTLNRVYDFKLNSNGLNRLISDIEFAIGRFYQESINDIMMSAKHYYYAHTASPDNIQYIGQLALVYAAISHPKLKKIVIAGLCLRYESSEDKYYYGLLKFLNNETEEAEKFYSECEDLKWPPYKSLLI